MKQHEPKSPKYKIAGVARAPTTPSGRPLLDASLEWIRDNPLATNLDVPVEFLDRWICNADQDDDIEFPLTVFMFGYCQRQLMKQQPFSSARMTVSASEVSRLFDLWQMKLALAELDRKTTVRAAPLPLFDFPADESVTCWMDGHEALLSGFRKSR